MGDLHIREVRKYGDRWIASYSHADEEGFKIDLTIHRFKWRAMRSFKQMEAEHDSAHHG